MAGETWGAGALGRVQLVDLDGLPYKAESVTQIIEGAEIDTSTLAKETTQEQIVQTLNQMRTDATATRSVEVTNPEMPLPLDAATETRQLQMITQLENLIAILGSNLSVVLDDTEALNVAVASLPLPTGASTAAKQDALLSALTNGLSVTVANDLSAAITSLPPVSLAPNQEVAVNGTVNIGNYPATQNVSGAVEVTNFPASTEVSGIATPVAVTDNGASLTVDGTVAVSNFPATQPVSLASVPTHPVTQSGTWNVNSTMASPSATGASVAGYRNVALLAAPQAIKTSAGRVLNYHIANPNNSWVYVHLYNATVAGTTVGTTAPLISLGIPANSVLDGTWMVSYNFGTAITIAATTTATGNTAPATGLLTNVGYA